MKNSRRRILSTSIAAFAATLFSPHQADAATGTWNVDAAGNWSATGNWTGGVVADGATFTANFTFNITAARTITLDTVRTIGNLVFTDATSSHDYTLAGTNVLTLDVASGASSISMTQAGRIANVNVPLAGTDGIVIPSNSLGVVSLGSNNSTFSGLLTVSNAATLQLGAGSTSATNASLGASGVGNETVVNAGGVLNVNGQNTGSTEIVRIAGFGNGTINGAALVNNGGGQNNALATVVLTNDAGIGGSGRFDIRNGTPLLDLAGFRLTKIGANQFSVVGGSITSGNIEMNAGTFSIESNTLVQGAGNITVNSGGAAGFWNNVAGRQTRTIALNGGTLNELGSNSATSTVSSPIVLSNNSTINVGPGGGGLTNFTLAGNIVQSGGNFGITKTAAGALTLTGGQTWTGPLTIADAGGRVNLAATSLLATRSVSVGDGAVLDVSAIGGHSVGGGVFTVGRTAGAGTDVFGNFNAGPGSTLNIGPTHGGQNVNVRTATFSGDLSLDTATVNMHLGAGGTSDRISAVNLSLNNVTNINILPHFGQNYTVGGFTAGAHTIGTYSGILTGGAANLAIGNAADYRQSFTIDTTSVPGSVLLNVAGSANSLTWDNASADGLWDVNGSTNWSGDKFYQIDRTVFGGAGVGSVNVVGTVRPSAIDFTAGNYTIGGGSISGPAIVTKTGADRVSLTSEFNDYSGGTTISGGTLAAFVYSNNAVAGSLGTGNVVIDGGALEYTGGTATSNRSTFLGASGGTVEVVNPLAVLALSTAVANSAGSGATDRDLVKVGPGVLQLNAAPTFSSTVGTSGIIVNEGVLRAGIANLGKQVTVASGATFDPNGFNGNTAGITRPTLNIQGSGVPGQAAIWNGGGAQTNTSLFGRINLMGDSTIGSPVRYDFNGGTGTDSLGVAGVTINADTFSLQLVGTGEKWWAPNGSAVVNDLLILQGRLGVQSSNNMASHPSITTSAIYVAPAGELATFGDSTNIKAVVLSGGTLASTGSGNGLATWRGGVSLGADSFVDNRGTGVGNSITINSDATQPTVAPLTLNGATLEKLGASGLLILQDSAATGLGSGDGNIRIYNGSVTMRGGFQMNGSGEVRIQNFGQLNLDDTGGVASLTKTVKLDGGTLNNAVGSHSTGNINVGAHGRVFNSAAGSTLTLGNIDVGANNGIQFGTTGSIVLGTINGGVPSVGSGNRLGVNWTAGTTPAATGFATWDGVSVGTLAPTVTNSTTPTAADDALYTAATTLSGSVTTNTLVSAADVIIPSGALLTVASGGVVMRGADHSINTAGGGTGRLTSGSLDGRLVVNAPEPIDTRGSLHIRAQIVDAPLVGGGFRPVTLQKNGPGQTTQMGTDNGGNMLSNLFSGGMVINGGRVTPNGTNSLGTGTVTINDGGQLAMFNLTGAAAGQASYIHNNVIATGRGAGENAGYLGAIRIGSNATLAGSLTVSDVTRIHNQNGQGGLLGPINGDGTVQHTGNNITWVSNPHGTFSGVTELGYRDQTGQIQVLVNKLANGGLPSSIGASSNAASNLVFQINPILRYVGTGDSTDRLFTLAGGFSINSASSAILDGSGYGALNFTNTGSLEFGSGSYRTLTLRASSLFTGATNVNGELPLNIFAPNLGDPTDHGFGQLTKDGIGRWAITADHTYSGVTNVNDGILVLGNGGTTGSFGSGVLGLGPNQVTIANNASVHVNRSNAYTIHNNIVSSNANGNSELVQAGSGTTTLAGSNDNSSTRVRVVNGELVLGKASSAAIHSAALLVTVDGGKLTLGGTGDDQIFDGATSGAWTTVQMNGGTFDMNGRNEAVYRVEGNGGTITNSVAGTTSTLTLGGSLVGTGNGSSRIGGGVGATIADGAGVVALTKAGTGRIALTGTHTYSGATSVNNGILSIGNGGTTGTLGSGPVTTGVTGTLAVDRSNAFVLTNPIGGSGGFTQQGSGTTTVTAGLLTYTGPTTVNRGILNVDLSTGPDVLPLNSRLVLNGGTARFQGGSPQTIGSLHVGGGNIEVSGAATLNLPANFTRLPGGTTDFAASGGGVINSTVANVNNVIGSAVAAYATYGGTDWAAQTANVIGALLPGNYAPDAYAPGNHTDVVGLAAIPSGTTGTLRLNTLATNALVLGGPLVLDQGGILVTPAMAAGSLISGGTITGAAAANSEVVVHQHTTGGIASATQLASVIVDNGANPTRLTKAGGGILALTGTNTFTGETHVNQGILSVGALGTAGSLGTGPVHNDATLAFARTDTITVLNSIGGNGAVVQVGGGTLRLGGTNSFTGGLLVAAGTVSSDKGIGGNAITANNLFGLGSGTTLSASNVDPASGAGTGTITLGDPTTAAAPVAFFSDAGADFANAIVVSVNGTGTASIGSSTIQPPTGSAGNPAMFTGDVTLNRATRFVGNHTDRTTYLGSISGPGAITITGTQTGTNTGNLNRTTWENDNTFTGSIFIDTRSTLQVGSGSFAAPRNQIPDNIGVTLGDNAFFTLNGDSETIATLDSTFNNSQVQSAAGGAQSLTVTNGGTFNGILQGSNNTGMTLEVAGGTMTLGGTADNSSGRIRASSGTVVLAKNSTTGVHASAVDLTVAGGDVRIAGSFTGGLPNYGTGVTLNAATFRDQIYDGANGATSTVMIHSGTLDLNGFTEGFGRLEGSGGTITNSAVGTTSTLFIGTANISTLYAGGYSGTIQDGAGLLALGKVGTGISIFTSDLGSAYSGGTTVYGGALQIGNGGNTGTLSGDVALLNPQSSSLIFHRSGTAVIPANISGAAPVIINGDGDVVFSGNNTHTGTTTVNGGSLIVGNGGSTGTVGSGNITLHGELHFNRSDAALVVSSAIAGGGDVVQEGTGTTTYTGVATHTGLTYVNDGTLLVNGSISGATVVNNATLGGTGTLGEVGVFGGTVAPGNSAGVLGTGNILFTPGSTYAVEVDSLASYDALNVAGTVNLGDATLTLSGSYLTTPSVTNDLFFIVRNDGSDPITNTFLGLPEGSNVFALNGQDYIISYVGDYDTLSATGGNDAVLTAVPEPGSIAMLLGGLAMLGMRRRRAS